MRCSVPPLPLCAALVCIIALGRQMLFWPAYQGFILNIQHVFPQDAGAGVFLPLYYHYRSPRTVIMSSVPVDRRPSPVPLPTTSFPLSQRSLLSGHQLPMHPRRRRRRRPGQSSDNRPSVLHRWRRHALPRRARRSGVTRLGHRRAAADTAVAGPAPTGSRKHCQYQ